MLLTLLPCLYLVETQIVTKGMKNGVFLAYKQGLKRYYLLMYV